MTIHASYIAGNQYSPIDLMERDKDFFSNGILIQSDLTTLQTDTPSMGVSVLSGVHWVDGYRIYNDSNTTLTIETADVTNPRIDIIVIGIDITTVPYYTPVLQVIKGTPSSSPIAPSIPGTIIGIKLAEVYVDVNVTSIINSNITDKRIIAGLKIKTTENITYYVNATTGNDINNGLTSETAFKTIMSAINRLPQIINHNITINLANGTYNEVVNISGFYGSGKIYLLGDTIVTSSFNVPNVIINSCHLSEIQIRGINATSDTIDGFAISSSSYIRLDYCSCIINSIKNGVIVNYGSVCDIYYGTYSNRVNGISVLKGSIATSYSNSGIDNGRGLSATNTGTIGTYGTQPAGATATYTDSGGEIR